MPENASIIDGIEVGRWLSIEQICEYRQKFPSLSFLFHGSNMIAEVGEGTGVEQRIQEYLSATGSAWFSVHLMVWHAGEIERLMTGERLPLPDPDEALERLLSRLEQVKRLVAVPVLIENLEPLPFDGYDFWSRPEYIRRALDCSGCGFLLDIGHLRVGAERMAMDEKTYLDQLPLEKVVEVHASGPRRRRGRLLDSHEHMQVADYRLLEHVISRQEPQVVTLEYTRDRDHLSQQLSRLRRVPGLDFSRYERRKE